VQEWMQKKLEKKKQEEVRKHKKEEIKQLKKQEKEVEKKEKLEKWFEKQASLTEIEILEKKRKEEEEKSKLQKKQKLEMVKKVEAEQAYQEWLCKKQEEKKINESNVESHKNANTVGQRRNSFSKKNSNLNSNKKKHSAFEDKLKMNIGPYSIAKELREYKRKLVEDLEQMENYNQLSALNQLNNYNNGYDEEKEQYENEDEAGHQDGHDYRNQVSKLKNKDGPFVVNGNNNNMKAFGKIEKKMGANEENDLNTNQQKHKSVIYDSNNSNKNFVYRKENTDPYSQEDYEEEAKYANKIGNYKEIDVNENSENIWNIAQNYQNDEDEQEDYENENANYNQNLNKNQRHDYLDNFEKEKIEDSLQELSSIKKDTPAQDDD